MDGTHTLARDAQVISATLSALIEWLSAYVEQRPSEMLTHALRSPQEAAQPPAPPTITDALSVTSYHVAMLRWLGEVDEALRKVPAGATALALARASSGHADEITDGAGGAVWQAMSPAELVMYVNNVHEAARLLAFYCAFLEMS